MTFQEYSSKNMTLQECSSKYAEFLLQASKSDGYTMETGSTSRRNMSKLVMESSRLG